jgi:hypothetical protein
VAVDERLTRAGELAGMGLQGLGVLLEAGDPWAQEVLEELIGPDDAPVTGPVAPADAEGAAVLAGLAPAGFTRLGELPAATEEADTRTASGFSWA